MDKTNLTSSKELIHKTARRRGCPAYGTEIMKKDEVLLYAEVAWENNPELSTEDVMEEVRLIDTILHMKELYKVAGPSTRYTSRGHIRKDNTWLNTLEGIFDGMIKGALK